MKRFVAGLLAMPLAALAQTADQAAPDPPLESHPIGTLVFVILFVGFCVMFGWMVVRNSKQNKKEDQ